ncbi:hypothetical protein ACHHYP_13252 [Achlya hypogyna]|uniref:Fungal lipase-type domain-containing protein n=1 Tax=Achlya hypogyna TaxID=1202772 RepID=A0A1V9YFL7_ACHHY|nr:hypothetical protein ACHHYP_13252 [Achlya hypogyna]
MLARMRLAALEPRRPSLATALQAPSKAVEKLRSIITNELLTVAKHDKLLNATCKWQDELLRPPSAPIVRLQVMSKHRLVGFLAFYYLVSVSLLSVIAWDGTQAVYWTPPVTTVGGSALLEVSPVTESFGLHLTSQSAAFLDAIVANATGTGSIALYAFADMQTVDFTDVPWTRLSPTEVACPPFSIVYNWLYQLKIDMYSVVHANITITSAEPATLVGVTTFTAPYMVVLMSAVLTAINIPCAIYFAYRIHGYADPTRPLPQWAWTQGLLAAVQLNICLPYSAAEYYAIVHGVAVSESWRILGFWSRLLGKNGARLAVLLFCDGMATTTPSRAGHFYAKKLTAVAVLTGVQGAYHFVSSATTEAVLLTLTMWLEFLVQCVMVVWLTHRRGRRVRQQPYRSATFQYTTFGVISFLVVPVALSSLYTLVRQTIVASAAIDQSPHKQQALWLGALVRDQMFAWIVLKCYIPLPSANSRRAATTRWLAAAPAEGDFVLTEADDARPSVFCLETAVTMLNLSVASYYTTHHHLHSASSFGHLGKDLPALDVLDCELLAAFHDPATDTNAVLVHQEAKKRYVLAFRGTGSIKNFFTDLKSRQMRLPGTDYRSPAQAKKGGHRDRVHVHSGFYQAYTTLLEHIHAAIDAIPDGSRVVTTGHSLGGALATIAALDMVLKHPTLHVSMYNFGSPRVGNHTFQELFNAKIPAFRVVNDGDVITQYPKRDYTNVDLEGVCVYKHVGSEITLLCGGDAVRGIVVKPTIVDRLFVLAHRNNFVAHQLGSYRASFRSLMHSGSDRLCYQRTPTPSQPVSRDGSDRALSCQAALDDSCDVPADVLPCQIEVDATDVAIEDEKRWSEVTDGRLRLTLSEVLEAVVLWTS